MSPALTEAHLRHLYRTTIDPLYGYVSRRTGGQRELAEDITHEAWLRAVREWPRTGVPDNPLAWLTTVARNLLINQFRRLPALPLDAVSDEAVLAAVESDVDDSAEIAQRMSDALAELPDAESQLLEAFHYQRQKVAELALAYGVSERAIEGRLRRAREHLRAILTRRNTVEGSIT